MKARQFLKAPYDSEGNPPRALLLYLITQLDKMQEPSAVSMPLALISGVVPTGRFGLNTDSILQAS
jgi:hypothetical protein